ncbi:MAG: UbiD family decarboxylase [Planctomycetaceae bacterium]|jgi:4-hydroxy-3-polyprenylbenzoate decarboxylase|nr:UbiD family decarboxylase [Planctomycetaceae bacterium]
MGYRNLQSCIADLRKTGQLAEYHEPVDPYLEVAAVQRRLYAAKSPAVLFTHVKNCRFPMLANLYGTQQRIEYIFRDGIEPLRSAMKMASEMPPKFAWKETWTLLKSWYYSRFKHTSTLRSPSVLQNRITPAQLPQLVSWQEDGGAYITLPQVLTHGKHGFNLGMYRVQISGSDYIPDKECGLHYQIQRGIALHHAEAKRQGQPLPVRIFIGGAPCMTLAAIMPLPENVSEILFAGILGQHRIPLLKNTGHFPLAEFFGIYSEADFCITGILTDDEKTEGPFGDHLGYYSLAHKFPVMKVTGVYHRKDAIYPFTVVGRPPQEDTEFGKFIHNITGDIVAKKLPGVEAVHAVDEAGVHPLLLAIGRETYPNELHTAAHSLLGSGQLALAKYLFIAEQKSNLNVYDVPEFFRYVLERVDWCRDIHFVTETSMDTLDYTGGKLNHGSKVFITASGSPKRQLALSADGVSDLPLKNPRAAMPGVLCIENTEIKNGLPANRLKDFPLIVIVDNAAEAASSIRNFLWTTFTKSNPAADIHGIDEFTDNKHWGCRGSLLIDARRKPHHAPELTELPEIAKRADEIAEKILTGHKNQKQH